MMIDTGGGFYNTGEIHAHTIVGRDQYNYYFIGLAPLVHDPTRRFRNFLNEYLGTPKNPVPFGGRQAQIEELDNWFDNSSAPPYYLMTAEAGRGKSALVCRWMEQLRQRRDDTEVIFIPISIRFETATQDVVFAALAARLAKLHDELLKPVALSGAQWQGVCESYLDRSLPDGKQLLIVLDGLDEATGWKIGAALFSTTPPHGLRVLVTARLRAGETTPHGWAMTLGWIEHLVQMATLPPLTRSGVEEALVSMGNPLDKLATKIDVVGELHRLSEGDPLIVRLYVDVLVAQRERVHQLEAEDLQSIQPGLAGYFERWWADQQEQWRLEGRDPIVEQANLRTLLNAIAAAMGPLMLDDLAALHSDLQDSMLVRRLVGLVERWLVGDGKAQGYSYSHPLLGYYFGEHLGRHEQEAWNGRFCGWGGRVLADLNSETLKPGDAPRYLLQHYAAHLERAEAPAEAFYALISNGWRKAWEVEDVSYGGFLRDVDIAWKTAQQAFHLGQPKRAEALIQQVRAALCHTSVAVLIRNTPSELLVQLLAAGLRTPAQVLAFLKYPMSEGQRVTMILTLAPHLPSDMINDVLIIAHEIEDEDYRSFVLSILAPYLSEFEREKALVDALHATHLMREELCAYALKLLAPHLSTDLLKQATYIARTIGDKILRTDILMTLALFLSNDEDTKFLQEALETACEDESDVQLAAVLYDLSTRVPVEFLEKALATIRVLKDDVLTAIAFSALASHLPENTRMKILDEELGAVEKIGNEARQARILCLFAPYLSTNTLERALNIADALENENYRAETLETLRLSQSETKQAKEKDWMLEIVYNIKDEYRRANALSDLVPELSTNVLDEVLSVTTTMNYISRTSLLGALAPRLSIQLLEEAMRIANLIGDKDDRFCVLIALTPYMPPEQIEEIIATARTIESEFRRADALKALASHMSVSLMKEILATACTFKQEWHRADVLSALAPHLPPDLLADALTVVHSIKEEIARADALNALAPYLSTDLIEGWLADARSLAGGHRFADFLGAVAPHLSSQLLKEALADACKIAVEEWRANAIGALAPYLPKDLMKEALATARVIESELHRATALGMLVPYLSGSEQTKTLEEVLAAIYAIGDKSFRTRAIITIVPYLPTEFLSEMLDAIGTTIINEQHLSEPLSALVPYLPYELIPRALAIARGILNKRNRATGLNALVPFLSAHEQEKVMEEALVAVGAIEDDELRVLTLGELSLGMMSPKLASDALVTACAIENEGHRADALRGLAPHLAAYAKHQPQWSHTALAETLHILAMQPRDKFWGDLAALMPFILALAGDEAPEAAEGIYHAIQEVCGWWP